MQLDLEVGVRVALGESAGVADRDQPLLFERATGGNLRAVRRRADFRDLPHAQRSSPRAAAMPASSDSMSLPTALLRLMSLIGTPRSIAARITAGSLAIV